MVPKHAQNHRPIAGAASSCFPPATTSPTVPRHASILHRAVASAAAAIASRGKWCPLFHAAASPEGSGSLLSWRGGASASHHNHGGTALFASSSSELSATSGGHGRDRDGQHNNGSILPSPFSIHNIPSCTYKTTTKPF